MQACDLFCRCGNGAVGGATDDVPTISGFSAPMAASFFSFTAASISLLTYRSWVSPGILLAAPQPRNSVTTIRGALQGLILMGCPLEVSFRMDSINLFSSS